MLRDVSMSVQPDDPGFRINGAHTSSSRSAKYTALILLITLLAFAARLINLGGDSLWADEIFTLQDSVQNPNYILSGQKIDHPAGYYLIEHYILAIWDASEYSLRMVSAFAGVVTIPLIYIIGSLLASRRVGLWAALLLAVAPFHIRYSQEARGYAIQVALAAASTICMLLALQRGRYRWWIGFGLITALSAYILYGSFIILAAQVVFVAVDVIVQWLSKRRTFRQVLQTGIGLAIGGLVALILYSPWIGHAVRGTLANIGSAKAHLTWQNTSLSDWLSTSYFAFGYMTDVLALLVGLLGALCLVYCLVRRKFDLLIWLIVSIFSPVLLITLADVSRAPLPKYILFVIIPYFVGAAVGLDMLVEGATRVVHKPSRFASLIPAFFALGLLVITLPLVRAEHAYVYNDFKGIAQYLQQVAHEGDVVVPVTLDLKTAFNQGSMGLGYYLPKIFSNPHILPAGNLGDSQDGDLKLAPQSENDVWFVVLNRIHPVQFDEPNIQVVPFQGDLYVVHSNAKSQPALTTIISLYEKIIPQTLAPAPQCYLWLDLSRLHIELEQYDEAFTAMSNFREPCPDSTNARQVLGRYLLDHYAQVQQVDRARAIAQQLLALNAKDMVALHYLLDDDLQVGRIDQAREIAQQLLAVDAKDQAALQVLGIYDLSAMFESSTSLAAAIPSPARPIQIQRFEMPQNGDWGDALVMQTPALLSFRLKLPPEPARFVSRVAMAPESWDWGGDGSVFQVQVQDSSGSTKTLYHQYVSNNDSDRTWHSVTLPLEQYAGQTITLTLTTDPGSNGDTTGDWAGWDSPHVEYALNK
jgi:mannosyltransferase